MKLTPSWPTIIKYAVWPSFYCLLLGAWHQNIGEISVKMADASEQKWNLLRVSKPYN